MAPNSTNNSTDKITLEKIKEEYIYGTITEDGNIFFQSYKKLSEKHKFSLDVIKKAGSDEKWPALKKNHRTKTALKIGENKSEFAAAKSIMTDDKFLDALELGRRVGVIQLQRYETYLNEDEKHFVSGTQYKHTIEGIVGCLRGKREIEGENVNKIKLEAIQDVKLHITDPDFMEQELDFANKLIDKRKEG